jgi:hypothetical protein
VAILKVFDVEQTKSDRVSSFARHTGTMVSKMIEHVCKLQRLKVCAMEDETPHDELVRLRKAQIKARQNEVYGGLSHAEQAEYNSRAARIRELEQGASE